MRTGTIPSKEIWYELTNPEYDGIASKVAERIASTVIFTTPVASKSIPTIRQTNLDLAFIKRTQRAVYTVPMHVSKASFPSVRHG